MELWDVRTGENVALDGARGVPHEGHVERGVGHRRTLQVQLPRALQVGDPGVVLPLGVVVDRQRSNLLGAALGVRRAGDRAVDPEVLEVKVVEAQGSEDISQDTLYDEHDLLQQGHNRAPEGVQKRSAVNRAVDGHEPSDDLIVAALVQRAQVAGVGGRLFGRASVAPVDFALANCRDSLGGGGGGTGRENGEKARGVRSLGEITG